MPSTSKMGRATRRWRTGRRARVETGKTQITDEQTTSGKKEEPWTLFQIYHPSHGSISRTTPVSIHAFVPCHVQWYAKRLMP